MKTNRSTEKKKKKKKKTWRRRKRRRRPDRPPALDHSILLPSSPTRSSSSALHQITHLDRFVLLPSSPTRSALRSTGFVFLQVRKNLVCKTRFWFLELESYRLEIYVAKLPHGSSRTRVWKRRFLSSISSLKNSRCYFPLSFHTVVNLLYTTSSHY